MGRSGFNGAIAPLEIGDADACAVESCNGLDDDCDGLVDEGCDTSCGTLAQLLDDFDDGARGPAWDVNASDATVSETDGALVLRPTTAAGSAAYVSGEALKVVGGAVTVEVVEMVDAATDAEGLVNIVRNGEGIINMRQQHGMLNVELVTLPDLQVTVVARVPYDPVAQRWWRLAFDAEKGSADVSADGVDWVGLGSFTPPFTPDLAHVSLVASASGAASPGQMRFDNFNGPGVGAFSNCPISTLQDDFNDDAVGPLWDKTFASGGATLTESAGDVVITPPVNGIGYAGLYATNRYDLRGSSLTARVTQVLAHTPYTESVLRLVSGDNEAFFLVRNNRILAEVAQEGSNVLADLAYDASLHRCWRFREDSGTLYWETAGTTCTTFTTIASMPITFDLGSVAIIAFAQAFAPVPTPGNMHIDSIRGP